MTQADPATVVGLVLAGGEGRRLGGVDKGLIPWLGRPMAAHVVSALGAILPDVLISANRSLEAYAELSCHVVTDPESVAGMGPLSGLLAGMRVARDLGYESVLVSPCDTPGVTGQLFSRLLAAAGPFPVRPTVASVAGRLQPLHGVYPVALIDPLEAWLAGGKRRVQEFAASVAIQRVDCSDFTEALRNYNTPNDFPDLN